MTHEEWITTAEQRAVAREIARREEEARKEAEEKRKAEASAEQEIIDFGKKKAEGEARGGHIEPGRIGAGRGRGDGPQPARPASCAQLEAQARCRKATTGPARCVCAAELKAGIAKLQENAAQVWRRPAALCSSCLGPTLQPDATDRSDHRAVCAPRANAGV
jgi:hypothetical protein